MENGKWEGVFEWGNLINCGLRLSRVIREKRKGPARRRRNAKAFENAKAAETQRTESVGGGFLQRRKSRRFCRLKGGAITFLGRLGRGEGIAALSSIALRPGECGFCDFTNAVHADTDLDVEQKDEEKRRGEIDAPASMREALPRRFKQRCRAVHCCSGALESQCSGWGVPLDPEEAAISEAESGTPPSGARRMLNVETSSLGLSSGGVFHTPNAGGAVGLDSIFYVCGAS